MKISLSTTGFNSKPSSKDIAQLEYNQVDVTIDNLIDYISDGYCFCNLYDFDDTFKFVGKGVKVNHYAGSYSINIDLDHQQQPIEETYNNCTLKPTFCYTSWSNSNDNYSYRFIYCFDSMIEGVEHYKNIYNELCTINNLEYDKHAESPYQYMNGTSKDCVVIKSDTIYHVNQFTQYNKSAKPNHILTHQNNMNGICTFNQFKNDEFKKDYFTLPLTQLISKYRYTFINKECSNIPDVDEDIPMIELDNYYEIHRLFRKSDGMCIKLKDGQNRKHKLYINCMVRRLITPTITFDDLLYDMLYEIYYFIDNRNDKITRRQLIDIVNNAMNADIYKFNKVYKGRKSMVNPKYQQKYGLSKRQIANEANANKSRLKKQQLYQSIGELYDFNKTVDENLRDFEGYGITVSKRTIQNWKKENGITRQYNKSANDNHILSEQNNMNVLCTFTEDQLKEIIINKIENNSNYINTDEFTNDMKSYSSISTDPETFQMDIYFNYIDKYAS